MGQRKIGILLSYSNIIVKNLVLIIYTPILLKYLGKSEYGLYQIANSVISNLTILNMGFSFAYIKFYTQASISDRKDAVKKLNGTYLLIFTVIATLSLTIGFWLVGHTSYFFSSTLSQAELHLAQRLMSLMVINITISFFGSVFDSSIMAHEQFKFQQSRQLIQSLLLPALTTPLLIFSDLGAISIVLIQTLLSMYIFILNLSFCVKKLHMKFTFKGLEFSLVKEIGSFSFFIFLNQVFNQINENGPTFILGMLVSTSQVAVYSITNQLKALFFTLSQSLTNIFIPKVNQIVHHSNDRSILLDLMIKIGRLQITILGFIFGGFIVAGKFFLLMWVGKGYEDSYYLLISIVIPLMFPLSQNLGIEIQRAMNKHVFRSIVLTLFALLNILITYLAVKYWGIGGSTLGYIISLTAGNFLLMNWYYSAKLKFDMKLFWRKVSPMFIPFVFSTIINLGVIKFFPISDFVSFLRGIITYCLTYMLIGYKLINEEERHMFQITKKKSH